MLSNYDKRDFPRMDLNCAARYRHAEEDDVKSAVAINLSGSGLLLRIEKPLEVGEQITVEVLPEKTITPPLAAIAAVVRCDPFPDGGFAIACQISKILSEQEAPPGIP